MITKLIQKLEFATALATLAATLLNIWLVVIPSLRVTTPNQNPRHIIVSVLILFLFPAVLTVIGAYVQTVMNNKIGFLILMLPAGFTVFIRILFLGVPGAYKEEGLLIGLSPGIFALLTIIFGLLNLLQQSKKSLR